MTDLFNKYARANKLLKDNEDSLSGEDIREGMTAVISIKIEDPQFEGQTKQKLGNNEARGAVSAIVSEQLTYFLEQNPSVAKMICDKAILAQRARAAARKARDLTRRKTALDSMTLPGKLADCTDKNPEKCELAKFSKLIIVVVQNNVIRHVPYSPFKWLPRADKQPIYT